MMVLRICSFLKSRLVIMVLLAHGSSAKRKAGSRKAALLLDAESGSLYIYQSLAFLVVRRKGGTKKGLS